MAKNPELRRIDANEAAKILATHAAKQPGRDLSRIVGICSRRVMGDFLDLFDGRYFDVCGSTRRDTHIPGRSDIDIGLLPRDRETQVADSTPVLGGLLRYLRAVRNELANDRNAKRLIAAMYSIRVPDVEEALRNADVEVDEHTRLDHDIITARFRLADMAFLEISSGTSSIHRVSVELYNTVYWDNRFATAADASTAAAHATLFKLVLRDAGAGYGYKNGVPSARGFEQLIVHHQSAPVPIEAALNSLTTKASSLATAKASMRPFLKLEGARRTLGLSGRPDHLLGNFRTQKGWKQIEPIASAIATRRYDWGALLSRNGFSTSRRSGPRRVARRPPPSGA